MINELLNEINKTGVVGVLGPALMFLGILGWMVGEVLSVRRDRRRARPGGRDKILEQVQAEWIAGFTHGAGRPPTDAERTSCAYFAKGSR